MNPSDVYAREITTYLEQRELVAFVGAGLSMGARLPGWYQLIAELAGRIDYALPPEQWATGDTLIEAAQAYINERNLNNLVRFLRDKLDTTTIQPSAAHKALARLPLGLVFTANYDDLLERAFKQAGKRVNLVVEDQDISLMGHGPDQVNIIKIYGDLNRPHTLVLARQQYEQFFLKRPQIVKLLETEFGRSAGLYLGWSHTDPHFKLLFGELFGRFGSLMRSGYAVMFEVDDNQRSEFRRKQIELIELPGKGDRTVRLANWLDSLAPVMPPPGAEPKDTIETLKSSQPAETEQTKPIRTLPDTATIRQCVLEAFPDQEFTPFCYDHFRPVYDYFATGMDRLQKVQILMEYCDRQGEYEKLLALIEKLRPHQYRQFFGES